MEEAEIAESDIAKGIENQDFDAIMKAAHRIKGSATYLGCEALRDSAYSIQQIGHDATNHPADPVSVVNLIKIDYKTFLSALVDLRVEIKRWFDEDGKEAAPAAAVTTPAPTATSEEVLSPVKTSSTAEASSSAKISSTAEASTNKL
jgi:chemotaxis protein histidine kinase CheA